MAITHRDLDPRSPMLVLIHGAKALRAAVRDVIGKGGVVQRCLVQKLLNVFDRVRVSSRICICC